MSTVDAELRSKRMDTVDVGLWSERSSSLATRHLSPLLSSRGAGHMQRTWGAS
jgi:hypothetical protein